MKDAIPPKPVGQSPKWFFLRAVWDRVFGGRFPLRAGANTTVEFLNGFYYVSAHPPGRRAEAGAELRRFRLKSVAGNYLVCRSWDGTTEGADDEYIAKPFKLRTNVTTEILDGITFTYSYNANNVQRTATSTDITEVQVITPRYIVNDEIFAFEAETGLQTVPTPPTAAEDITLIDQNLDARAWLRGV